MTTAPPAPRPPGATGRLHGRDDVLVELEARDFVVREVDPSHRRRNIVAITDSGSDVLRKLDVVLDSIQEELLAPLSLAQRQQFGAIMSRLGDL